MSQAEFAVLSEDCSGFCLACGAIRDGGCEPDARGYECGSCGARQVYGLEECALMMRVVLEEEGTETSA